MRSIILATTLLLLPFGAIAQTLDAGMRAYQQGDHAAALEEFTALAERGDARAQVVLGKIYATGEVVAKDYAEAAHWYREAAEQGSAKAQYSLALIYDREEGEESANWYDKALAFIDDREGVPQDHAEAVRWYRKAAEQGHAEAQYELGETYHYGSGVTLDYAEAARWYRKAAEQGHAEAQYELGERYQYGSGVTQDYAEAIRWHRKAAEQGHAEAQNELGRSYRDGEGVPEDKITAHMWANIASANGAAGSLRHYIAKRMSSDAVVEAQRRAKKCMASDYQDCD